MSTRIEMKGKKIGAWTVIGSKPTPDGQWLCRCDCGRELHVWGRYLRHGRSSCCKACARKKHGHTQHGKTPTKTYMAWRSMKHRCLNPLNTHFHNYGGRGITICERWMDFTNFLHDMGEKPKGRTLERVDNNKGYSSDNCIWATPSTQMRNTRRNHRVTFNGKTLCLIEWAELIGLPLYTIQRRIAAGWTPEKTLTTPLGKYIRK